MGYNGELFMLKPSAIEGAGVGCFAVADIMSGTRLIVEDQQPNRKLSIDEIPDSHLKYCPLLESGLFLAPSNFAIMSVFWYVNHAKDPNVMQDRWRMHAARDIEAGEELVLYYPDLLTHPKNAEWVIPELHV